MKTINQQLDDLFIIWRKEMERNGEGLFTKDGILYKHGKPRVWVDEQWRKSERRIVFLLKDNSTTEDSDVREWLIDERNGEQNRKLMPPEGKCNTIMKKLASLLYGMYYISPEWGVWPGELSESELIKAFNNIPFAIVETKKMPGTTSIDNDDLREHIQKYQNFLRVELIILNPSIVVCCGGEQHNFMLETYFDKSHRWTYSNKNVHYDQDSEMLIVYADHPSYWVKSLEDYYEGCLHWVRKFIDEYKGEQIL